MVIRTTNSSCLECGIEIYVSPCRKTNTRRCLKCSHRKRRLDSIVNISCSHCNNMFILLKGEYKRRVKRFGNSTIFCSRSCRATYYNRNKTKGIRKSKLEVHLAEFISVTYKDLVFTTNKTDIIGYELDFYFPSLNFAIEINGIFHYEPIFGAEKLSKTQYTDKQKILLCESKNIELAVIATLDNNLTQSVLRKYEVVINELLTRVMDNRKLWGRWGTIPQPKV